jgi:hypothetical protein
MSVLKLKTNIMRNSITILTIALFFVACSSSKSQTAKETNVTFEDQLSKTLTAINGAKSVKGLFENSNKLKRLSAIYPNEWLSDYYVTLLDIKLSMGAKDEKKKESLLNEAKEFLASLKEKENTIESEILTLNGYYYYALIAQNPQKNGQLYYKDVIGAYQKAIAIDKTNPRPVLMLTIFKKKMSKFVGGDLSNLCTQLSQIEQLLESSKPKNEVYPKWGIKELKKEQQESCNKL